MALEGLLARLGPTLVREATPHLMQALAGFGERFRNDTREIKGAMDAELASLARTHASLATSVSQQGERLQAVGTQVAVLDRKIELLHKAVEGLSRQLTNDAMDVAKLQRTTRTLVVLSVLFSALVFMAAVALLVLHR